MQRLENWDDIRYFLSVARTGTLAAAARELNVNQSTVYRRVEKLEQALKARLFDRMPRGYALTAVGEEMVTLATRIEDDVLALDRTVSGADHQLVGSIRITTVDEILARIAPHLCSFRTNYPGIDLEVNTDQRLFSLSRREADIAIRPGTPPTEPDVLGRKLVRLASAAYASSKYLKGRKRPRRRVDLANHSLIGFDETRKHTTIDKWLRGQQANIRVVFRANSMMGQLIAVQAGLGIAILPCFMGDADPNLEKLFSVTEEGDYHVWLLVHSDFRQTARVRAFVEFVSKAVISERDIYEGTIAQQHRSTR